MKQVNMQFSSLERPTLFSPATAINQAAMQVDDSSIHLNVSIETVTDFCAPGFTSSSDDLLVSDCTENVYDMDTYYFQDTATFQYTLDSSEYLLTFPSPLSSEAAGKEVNVSAQGAQAAVMLRGSLEGMSFSPVGGSMSIEATFRPVGRGVGGGDSRDIMQGSDFNVYVQTGGIAHAGSVNTDGDDSFLLPHRKVVLSSPLLQMKPSSADESETIWSGQQDLISKKFRWIYHKPKLADIIRHQEGDYFIYFNIIANETVSVLNNEDDGTQYMVSMRVTFSPCLESTCKHGECIVSDDGMLVSSCSCRYFLKHICFPAAAAVTTTTTTTTTTITTAVPSHTLMPPLPFRI
jgi:hypothetical protein